MPRCLLAAQRRCIVLPTRPVQYIGQVETLACQQASLNQNQVFLGQQHSLNGAGVLGLFGLRSSMSDVQSCGLQQERFAQQRQQPSRVEETADGSPSRDDADELPVSDQPQVELSSSEQKRLPVVVDFVLRHVRELYCKCAHLCKKLIGGFRG